MYAIVVFIDVIERVFTENSRFMYGKIAGKIDVKIQICDRFIVAPSLPRVYNESVKLLSEVR